MAYSSFSDSPNLNLWSWLLASFSGIQPQLDVLPMQQRAHDWPSNGSGPLGEECCDCVLMTSPWQTSTYVAVHYESFAPSFGVVSSNPGNGGDLLAVTSDRWIKIFATQDGGRPGELIYFVGPGLGMPGVGPGGWVISGPDVAQDVWHSCVTQIAQSYPGPYSLLNSLSPAYTRYVWSYIDIPNMSNGILQPSLQLPCLISEHYNGPNPSTAVSMERFVFAPWYGKVRWEAWAITGTPSPGAVDRAPTMPYCYPTSDAAAHMSLMDARTYTNFWSEAFTVNPGANWPGAITLP